MKKIIILVVVMLSLTSCFEEEKQPLPKGVMLTPELDEIQGEKIIVNEFFWYGCPHCNAFRPYLAKFEQHLPADVKLIHTPVPLLSNWVDHAKMYYAILELKGFSQKLHKRIFTEIHQNKNKLKDEKAILDFMQKLGFNRAQFQKVMNSNAVADKILADTETITWLGLRQTPVVVINNKYKITVASAGDYNKIIPTLERLLDYIRAEKSKN